MIRLKKKIKQPILKKSKIHTDRKNVKIANL